MPSLCASGNAGLESAESLKPISKNKNKQMCVVSTGFFQRLVRPCLLAFIGGRSSQSTAEVPMFGKSLLRSLNTVPGTPR